MQEDEFIVALKSWAARAPRLIKNLANGGVAGAYIALTPTNACTVVVHVDNMPEGGMAVNGCWIFILCCGICSLALVYGILLGTLHLG